MFHRTQQLRVDPRQSGQRLRIHAVIFLPALSDQTHVAGMRNDHFVSQPAEHANDRPIKTDGQILPAKLCGLLPRLLIFFNAGLLLSVLRARRYLGSIHRIPSGDRRSHPI